MSASAILVPALAAQGSGTHADEIPVSPAEATPLWPYISLGLGVVIAAAVAASRRTGLGGAPKSRWRLSPAWSLALFALMLCGASLGAAGVAAILAIPQDDHSLRALVATGIGAWVAQMAVAAILLHARATKADGPPAWGVLGALGLGIAVLAISWFPLQSAGSIVASAQEWLGGVQPPETGHTSMAALMASGDPWLRTAMIVNAVVMAPIAEELLFRGAAQQGLRGAGFGRWWAISTTSVLFAIVHLGVLEEGAVASGLAMLFVLAMVLGWLAERTGRLAAPIAAHAAFNAANLAVALSA